jgi:glycosyltransferase involved in cell wall biosynthesis
MKYLIFTVTTDLSYDQRMDRICTTMAYAGYRVLLVGSQRKGSIPLQQKNYQQHRIKCLATKESLFYLEFNFRLFFYLLFRKAGLICGVDLDTLLASYSAALIRRKKFVYDAHEYFTEMVGVRKHPLVYHTWSLLERMILPHVKHAYTVSQSLADVYSKKYRVDFKVIRNISSFNSSSENKHQVPAFEERYLVYAGVVNEGRGLDECIEAMQFIDCKLYICGDGDMLDKLKQMVVQKRLEAKIIFTGYLEPKQLKEVIRKAYAGLLLLRADNLNFYYSLANKFFDYLHAGIPQITINLPEYILLNRQYQVAELIELEVQQIVAAANLLLNDAAHYNLLKANTLKARQELNWEKEAEKLVGFYREVLG